MPDICMCVGVFCPQKNDCYRYRAVPNEVQDYFNGMPNEEDKKTCHYFYPIKEGYKVLPLNGKKNE